MPKGLSSFKLNIKGRILDYRLGKKLDLKIAAGFFAKKYIVKKLWQDQRHVLGILEKNDKQFFLKLATTEGVGVVTKIEFNWNEQFNTLVPRNSSGFWVPKNFDSGFYQDKLFYLITDKFSGELLAKRPTKTAITSPLLSSLSNIIDYSEFIQTLNIINLSDEENPDYQQWFINKAESWYNDIPDDVREKYKVNELLEIVKGCAVNLQKRPRHGDFTPWHLFKLRTGQLGLIDGEHAKTNGVENYDICYFIQRVYCIMKNPVLAKRILEELKRRNYDLVKLQTVLAARAIGGFLDESLKHNSDFYYCGQFKKWVLGV